jgi:glycosyltransferase involved in cell wall biosynthesis
MAANGPLRIVHCFRSPVGGIFRHVRELALEHSQAGHQVGIVCDSSTGGSFEDELFDEIRPHLALGLTRIPINRSVTPSDMRALWNSYKQIKSLQPDVLHGHGAKGGAIARIIGSLLRVNKYCVTRLYSPHGGSVHFGGTVSAAGVFLIERILSRMGDATVFVCEFERDAYFDKIGNPGRNEVIYNGIESSEFKSPGLISEPSDFVYVGMLRDLKGPDVFVRAFAAAERIVGRPLSALLVGDGPDRDKYNNMIIELGLAQRIVMMPAMKQRQAFKLAKTVVVPSRAEAMPYIVLEAVAAGKPVIATRVGGIPEVLGRDSPALVPAGDWKRLGEVMAASVTDTQWKAAAQPDMRHFRETFSSKSMSEKVLALYQSLLLEIEE